MDIIRRICAIVIALSLALPQRSCVNGGQIEIHYPLSNLDSGLSVALVVALYTLPLIVLLFSRFRLASVVVGIAAVATGLYFFSYGATLTVGNMMLGWYTYTVAALAYLFASLVQLQRVLLPRRSAKADVPDR